MPYILIQNPNTRQPVIYTDHAGYIITFSDTEQAEMVGENLILDGICKEYQIYEQQ